MSSFICSDCGILNLDSDTGFVSGCLHHTPLKDGLYQVHLILINQESGKIERHSDSVQFKAGAWVNHADDVVEWRKM